MDGSTGVRWRPELHVQWLCLAVALARLHPAAPWFSFPALGKVAWLWRPGICHAEHECFEATMLRQSPSRRETTGSGYQIGATDASPDRFPSKGLVEACGRKEQAGALFRLS